MNHENKSLFSKKKTNAMLIVTFCFLLFNNSGYSQDNQMPFDFACAEIELIKQGKQIEVEARFFYVLTK